MEQFINFRRRGCSVGAGKQQRRRFVREAQEEGGKSDVDAVRERTAESMGVELGGSCEVQQKFPAEQTTDSYLLVLFPSGSIPRRRSFHTEQAGRLSSGAARRTCAGQTNTSRLVLCNATLLSN